METQKIKIKTAVVILNWNGKDWLEQFLLTVVNNSDDATVFVVDNDSRDDSKSFLTQEFSEIKIIKNKENLGFAGGYNRCFKYLIKAQHTPEYIMMLNNDTIVESNILNEFEYNYYQTNYKNIIKTWEKNCCHINKNITFNKDYKIISGKFAGLANNGNAIINIDGEKHTMSGGIINL